MRRGCDCFHPKDPEAAVALPISYTWSHACCCFPSLDFGCPRLRRWRGTTVSLTPSEVSRGPSGVGDGLEKPARLEGAAPSQPPRPAGSWLRLGRRPPTDGTRPRGPRSVSALFHLGRAAGVFLDVASVVQAESRRVGESPFTLGRPGRSRTRMGRACPGMARTGSPASPPPSAGVCGAGRRGRGCPGAGHRGNVLVSTFPAR